MIEFEEIYERYFKDVYKYALSRAKEPDKLLAMKNAWVNAFSSISSSALTTVAGLLMLLFMSFKIGADIGIVMAKGVFLSMVCVLTVLPALIVLFDSLLLIVSAPSCAS